RLSGKSVLCSVDRFRLPLLCSHPRADSRQPGAAVPEPENKGEGWGRVGVCAPREFGRGGWGSVGGCGWFSGRACRQAFTLVSRLRAVSRIGPRTCTRRRSPSRTPTSFANATAGVPVSCLPSCC